MSENREKKEKMTAEARAAAAERLEEALGALPPRYFDAVFGADAAAEEKKSAKKARKRTAPAWLRPVAACLAVLILGGLVVFSIPVVNNILTRRAPAELPGTDPVAEADTKEEETEKKEETEKPVETEAPVETEEIEVSQFDRLHSVMVVVKEEDGNQKGIYAGASFNDLLSGGKYGQICVARAEEVSKIKVGMTIGEVDQTMDFLSGPGEGTRRWALDDGTVLEIKIEHYNIIGYSEDHPGKIVIDPEGKTEEELVWEDESILLDLRVLEVNILDDPKIWNAAVDRSVKYLTQRCIENKTFPEWLEVPEWVKTK